ncbi:MAG: SpoIIE family protein phosphatase [Rhodocyclaceae bacterium]|nr:SpoIIE family protein phosphatase [Rhodocyclaceae bacterium]
MNTPAGLPASITQNPRLPIHVVGLLIAIALGLTGIIGSNYLAPLRLALFDSYQRAFPRQATEFPVTIVQIDEASLQALGQWPWPRIDLATLVQLIGVHKPRALVLDVLMPEADRHPPGYAPEFLDRVSPALAQQLRERPGNDTLLGHFLSRTPSVGAVGLLESSDSPPIGGNPPRPIDADANFRNAVAAFSGVLHAIPEVENSVRGLASATTRTEAGVVRRMPVVARVNEDLWPTLAAELLRVAEKADRIQIEAAHAGMRSARIGAVNIPIDDQGRMWLYFAEPDPKRVVSALDVFAERVDPKRFEDKIVLVGFSALGLQDNITIPGGALRAGVEAHATALENILTHSVPLRPAWLAWIEAGIYAAGCSLALWRVPRTRSRFALPLFAAGAALLVGCGFVAFRAFLLLLDVAVPLAGISAVFAAVLALSLVETERTRRRLAGELATQREERARLNGELEAARRIQLGLLPRPSEALGKERRADVAALIQPALSVGGDLYDFFLLPGERLFVAIGDVSGKGVPASLFMALSKSLAKSSALRDNAALDAVINRAHVEIARDNPEAMFVTFVALVLDLQSGRVEYVNAGHEYPLVVSRGGVRALDQAGGPPLCVLEDYCYERAQDVAAVGDFICLVTDGVTEAINPVGGLYGRERLAAVLAALPAHADAAEAIDAVLADVLKFADGAQLPDDLTIVVVKWAGPDENSADRADA